MAVLNKDFRNFFFNVTEKPCCRTSGCIRVTHIYEEVFLLEKLSNSLYEKGTGNQTNSRTSDLSNFRYLHLKSKEFFVEYEFHHFPHIFIEKLFSLISWNVYLWTHKKKDIEIISHIILEEREWNVPLQIKLSKMT